MRDIKKEKAIIGIIHDSLIVDRVFEFMFQAGNVHDPIAVDNRFSPQHSVNGIKNAFLLLGVDNQELEEELYRIFDNVCYSTQKIEGKAEKIYFDWLSVIIGSQADKIESLTKTTQA